MRKGVRYLPSEASGEDLADGNVEGNVHAVENELAERLGLRLSLGLLHGQLVATERLQREQSVETHFETCSAKERGGFHAAIFHDASYQVARIYPGDGDELVDMHVLACLRELVFVDESVFVRVDLVKQLHSITTS